MPSLHSIRSMKRVELQATCKAHKLKANGKTDELMQQLIAHFGLESPSLESATAPPTAIKVIKKPINVASTTPHLPTAAKRKHVAKPIAPTFLPTPQRPASGDDDDDEMRLQTPVLMRTKKISSSQQQPQTTIKKTSSNALLRRALDSSYTPARPKVAVQAEASFSTSPATKKIITTLLSTVESLQAELLTTRSTLNRLESAVKSGPTTSTAAPSTPPLKRSEVLAIVDDRINTHRSEVNHTIEDRFAAATAQLEELRATIPLAETEVERQSIERLEKSLMEEVQVNREWRQTLEADFQALRSDLSGQFMGRRQEADAENILEPAEEELDNLALLEVEEMDGPVFIDEVGTEDPELPEEAEAVEASLPAPVESAQPAEPAAVGSTDPASPAGATAVESNEVGSSPKAPLTPAAQAVPSSAMSEEAPPIETLASYSSPVASPRGMSTTRQSPTKRLSNLHGAGTEPALALPPHMLSHVSPMKGSLRRRTSSPRHSMIATPTVPMSPARSVVRSIGKRSRRDSDMSDVSTDASFVVATVISPPSKAMGGISDTFEQQEVSMTSSRGGRVRKRMRVSSVVSPRVVARQEIERDEERSFEDEQQSDEESAEEEEEEEEDEEREIPRESSPSGLDASHDFIVSTKPGSAPTTPAPTTALSDPAFFAHLPQSVSTPSLQSAASPAPGDRSMPIASLPFPIASPFGRKSPARSHIARSLNTTPRRTPQTPRIGGGIFGDASNRNASLAIPPTPPASKTMYGTERFGDEEEEEGASLRFGDAAMTPARGGAETPARRTPSKKMEWTGFGLFGAA